MSRNRFRQKALTMRIATSPVRFAEQLNNSSSEQAFDRGDPGRISAKRSRVRAGHGIDEIDLKQDPVPDLVHSDIWRVLCSGYPVRVGTDGTLESFSPVTNAASRGSGGNQAGRETDSLPLGGYAGEKADRVSAQRISDIRKHSKPRYSTGNNFLISSTRIL